ncbi:MAG TPA: hypothetical protein VNI77_12205, partial [Nitrososphaera sp.]|nr:hypothetical protein [Nitrososphaera sp.]
MVATEGTARRIKTKSVFIVGIAVAAVLAASLTAYMQSSMLAIHEDDSSSLYNPSNNDANLQKGPPPMPLSGWGPKLQSFDEAKESSGLATISLPTRVPSEVAFDSARVLSSPGDSTSIVTVFYTPKGVTADDTTTFQDIMSNGGIAIVYAKESVSPEFDRDKWMEDFVNEAPEVRRIVDINNTPAVVNMGNMDQEITAQVLFYKGGVQINLVSLKYTDT